MKKTIVCSFTGLLLACILTSLAYSQKSTALTKLPFKAGIMLSAQFSEENEDDRLLLNEINTKALRDFKRSYKAVTDAKWFRSGDGFVVYFHPANDVKTKVYYDKKGNYQCRVRSYNEDKLIHRVRHLVKSNYYDFDIYWITEINAKDETAYIINLESKTSWKVLKIVDEEIEIVQDYSKADWAAFNPVLSNPLI